VQIFQQASQVDVYLADIDSPERKFSRSGTKSNPSESRGTIKPQVSEAFHCSLIGICAYCNDTLSDITCHIWCVRYSGSHPVRQIFRVTSQERKEQQPVILFAIRLPIAGCTLAILPTISVYITLVLLPSADRTRMQSID
jgi:hypothetical protein